MKYAMRSALVLLILASPHIASSQTVDEVMIPFDQLLSLNAPS